MEAGLVRKRFDAQSALATKAADNGSKLGKGRLWHGGTQASRDRSRYAITYMLVGVEIGLEGRRKAGDWEDEREDRGGVDE
jgi:hypothetical protein